MSNDQHRLLNMKLLCTKVLIVFNIGYLLEGG